MKCPNCNADIKEGSIICPICNTQFAFTANDNFINLPDDEFVIKSGGVEEYVDPHENDANKPVNSTPGVLNLKSNPTPKKVIKKVVKVNTSAPQEESVEITPSVNIDMNDEVIDNTPTEMDTQVVEIGGFTNTIIDTTSAISQNPVVTPTPTPSLGPALNDLTSPMPLNQIVNNAKASNEMISNVGIQTNTIGQVSKVETEEVKPKKKMSETMMIALIMGLILILLCFIIYILLENNKKKEDTEVTTTQMTTFNCDNDRCSTTTTVSTTEITTTTTERLKNKGLKSTVEMPLSIGQTSVCDIYDNGKSYKVDVSLTKIYTPEEAQRYMQNYNNTGYQEGLSVGVLEYTLTGNELDDGVEIDPVTSISFYPASIYNKFRFNDSSYSVGFVGNATEKLSYGKTVKVTGYYNFPSDQPVAFVCIGDYDADQKGCFKLN